MAFDLHGNQELPAVSFQLRQVQLTTDDTPQWLCTNCWPIYRQLATGFQLTAES